MKVLRPYQVTAVEAALRELRAKRRALIVMATGGGKTICFAFIAEHWRSAGRVLVLAHREELLDQAADKIASATSLSTGIEQADRRVREPLPDVVIASVQTLLSPKRRAAFAPNAFDLVIVDEAHHGTANSYREVLGHFSTAAILGVTATPDRADGAPLSTVYGRTVFRYGIRTAVRDGYLVDIRRATELIADLDLSRVRVRAGDFDAAELEAELLKAPAVASVADAILRRAGERPTVAFCAGVAHSRAVASALNARRAGCATFASGEDRGGVADLLEGRARILCNADLTTEGFDCLDQQTEILTERGWRGMGGVGLDDRVYALNRETLRMELVDVQRYVERPVRHGEQMFTIKSQHVDIRTTEGHQFHVRYRDTNSRPTRLSPRVLTLSGRELNERSSNYALPLAAEMDALPGIPLSDDELRLVAWFMTDGGFVGTKISISQSKEKTTDEIRALLQRLRLDFRERVRPGKKSTFPSKLTEHEFRIPKGTHPGMPRRGWNRYEAYLSKAVAPALHNMNRRQFLVFWEEALKGDGSNYSNGKSGWLWCATKEQADAYTHMAVVRGLSASYAEEVTAKGTTVYRVSVRDAQWLTSDPRDSRAAKRSLEEPAAGERVWCVSNRLSTLVTRRNGKVAIIGNCPPLACVALVRPTKSVGRATQQVGRGTRLSPETGKADLLVLEFVGGTVGNQVTTVDVVGSDLPQRVRSAAERLLDVQPGLSVLIALERAAAAAGTSLVNPVVSARPRAVLDPMKVILSLDGMVMEAPRPGAKPATAEQVKLLEAEGLRIAGLDVRQAAMLLAGIRWRRGHRDRWGRPVPLCSPTQAIMLAGLGFEPDVPAVEATKRLAQMRAGWAA